MSRRGDDRSEPAFAEVHDELRAVARDLLGAAAAGTAGGEPVGLDWPLLARSGWLGLEVPGDLGGAGATLAEVAVVAEELGRVAAVGPFLGSVVLGVGALGLVAPSPERDRLLAGIAAGERRVAVAAVDGAADVVPAPVPFRLERTAVGGRLAGSADFVPDAPGADDLLVVAVDPAGEPVLVHLLAGGPGTRVEPQAVLDATRSLGRVRADGAPVPARSVWRFTGDPARAPGRLHRRGAVALAGDALGLARAMLDATVAYAGTRVQFGRPIGSFQAVKHACADMLVKVALAEELVAAAVAGVAGDGTVGADPGGAVAASMAKSYACGAAVEVVGKALQLHGGIGYTWEGGIHLHLKRALLDRALFGSPAAHRRFLGARHLAPGPAVAGGGDRD